MTFFTRLVVDVIHATTIALGTDLITLIASSAGNHHSVLSYGSTAVTFSAVRKEHNGRDVVVVGISPVRLCHEAVVTPVLIGVEPGIFHPHRVVHHALHGVISLSTLAEPLIISESLVVLTKSLVILSESLIISPLIVLVWILPLVVLVISPLVRLVRIRAIISPPLVLRLNVSPLVWLVGIVTPCVVVLIGILPLVVLVVAPLTLSLVRIEALIGIIVEALSLSLVAPHYAIIIGYNGQKDISSRI